MPRKKVAAEDRIRAAKACGQCRQRKKKCDGGQPCANCVKRGSADQCDLDKSTPSPRAARESFSQASFSNDAGIPTHVSSSTGTGSPEVSVRTHLRMLSNARGERVFIGEHASLSFLQLMRDIVRTSIGASEFSAGPRQDSMLEADLESGSETTEDLITSGPVEAWIDSYLVATNGLVDLFDKQEILLMLQAVRIGDDSGGLLIAAIVNLVLAIGAQVGPYHDHAHEEHVLFATGRKMAFRTFLEDPGLMTVQAFVLCAFYMFGACRRNAAYMYLGIAMRAAHAIGLHNSMSYRSLSKEDALRRTRSWRSLFTLDLAACSILGRPSANPTMVSNGEEDLSILSNELTQAQLAVQASYKLAKIVEEVSSKLSGRRSIQAEEAEQQLEILQTWSRALPSSLRMPTRIEISTNIMESRRSLIGNLHISCFYHFSILLVTRPFLIPVLMKRIAGQQQDNVISGELADAADEARATRLAHTCVNVAIHMAQMCWSIREHEMLMENMCILKAWIFAAALVIGFHLFSNDLGTDAEAETAFTQSRSILQFLSIRSPQAKHYHEILNYLHDAVQKRRQQRQMPSRKQNSFDVDHLLNSGTFLIGNTESASYGMNDTLNKSNTFDFNDMSDNWMYGGIAVNDMDAQNFFQTSDFGWNTGTIPFWDQFSFEP